MRAIALTAILSLSLYGASLAYAIDDYVMFALFALSSLFATVGIIDPRLNTQESEERDE